MFHRLSQRLAGCGIPDSRGLPRSRQDPGAVRAELDGRNDVLMCHRLAQRLARGRVLNLHGLVRCGQNPFAVWAESICANIFHTKNW